MYALLLSMALTAVTSCQEKSGSDGNTPSDTATDEVEKQTASSSVDVAGQAVKDSVVPDSDNDFVENHFPAEGVTAESVAEEAKKVRELVLDGLWGQFGGAEEVRFSLEGAKGEFWYVSGGARVERDLQLVSYEETYNTQEKYSGESGGRLVVNVLEKNTGKYIGRMEGEVGSSWEQLDPEEEGSIVGGSAYKGTFVNYKGVKLDFSLYAD